MLKSDCRVDRSESVPRIERRRLSAKTTERGNGLAQEKYWFWFCTSGRILSAVIIVY